MDLGFRFYIVGMKDGLYAVRDYKDLSTEMLSYEDVMKYSKSVKIMGVTPDGINLDWFIGYIRREWTFKPSVEYFMNKFGLTFAKIDSRFQLCLCTANPIILQFNYAFFEFVTSFDVLTSNLKVLTTLLESVEDSISQKEKYGVGFNYIEDNNLRNISVNSLYDFNFDKYAKSCDSLSIIVALREHRVINMELHSSRPVTIKFNGSFTHLTLKRLVGTDVTVRFDCKNVFIADKFLDCVKLNIQSCMYAHLYVKSRNTLVRLYKSYRGNIIISYCLSDNVNETPNMYSSCIILGVGSENIVLGYGDDFIISDIFNGKLNVKRRYMDSLMGEEDFERRHNISFERFISICEVV